MGPVFTKMDQGKKQQDHGSHDTGSKPSEPCDPGKDSSHGSVLTILYRPGKQTFGMLKGSQKAGV